MWGGKIKQLFAWMWTFLCQKILFCFRQMHSQKLRLGSGIQGRFQEITQFNEVLGKELFKLKDMLFLVFWSLN